MGVRSWPVCVPQVKDEKLPRAEPTGFEQMTDPANAESVLVTQRLRLPGDSLRLDARLATRPLFQGFQSDNGGGMRGANPEIDWRRPVIAMRPAHVGFAWQQIRYDLAGLWIEANDAIGVFR